MKWFVINTEQGAPGVLRGLQAVGRGSCRLSISVRLQKLSRHCLRKIKLYFAFYFSLSVLTNGEVYACAVINNFDEGKKISFFNLFSNYRDNLYYVTLIYNI